MPIQSLNPQVIKQNGWKQGSGFLINESTAVSVFTWPTQKPLLPGCYVVLSHDCDILNPDLQKEPVVELIQAGEIDKCNHELTSGKNPRKLHLELDQKSCYEFLPHKRHFIERTYLEQLSVNGIEITGRLLKILTSWIAKRYRRHGFPDAFNERCRPVIKEIKKILSNEAKNIQGIYIRFATEEELDPSETYKIIFNMLVPKDIFDNEQKLLDINEGFEKIVALIDRCNGIKVITGSRVLSMDDVTVHDYQKLKEWDFDYISFLNGDDNNIY